ncbi:uncharacterized protein [Clytia hemisphaerica]|uniref:Fibrinogen C-terminal domain-containing protein n=1 Tax=Clytia hemisphaerica TaxID=252671 RepID=A0A7M5X8R7_9CNID
MIFRVSSNLVYIIGTVYLCSKLIAGNNQFSPNIRYHSPHANTSLNYSYINLKHVKGHKLDVTPLATYSVKNRSMCVKECVKTKGECKSINLQQQTNGYGCEILDKDIYITRGKLVNDPSITHSLIANKCMRQKCEKGYMCVPNYLQNTFSCQMGSCKEIKEKIPSSPSGYYNILLAGYTRTVFCDMEEDMGGWMLIANYSIEETNNPPRINYINMKTYFTGAHMNGMVLSTSELVPINEWSSIQEIRFQCYKPSHGRMVHFKNNIENKWGRYLIDYVLKRVGVMNCKPDQNNAACSDIGSSLTPMSGDTSFMSSQSNRFGWGNNAQRLYNHGIYGGPYHYILINGRLDCDDHGGFKGKGSWWRIYLR